MSGKKAEFLKISKAEAKLALKGVGELPYSDDGIDFCKKLEVFLDE